MADILATINGLAELVEELEYARDEMSAIPRGKMFLLEKAGYSRDALTELFEKSSEAINALLSAIREKDAGLGRLLAHVEAMQGKCSQYLEPAIYQASNGMLAGAKGDVGMRDKLFISDMILMLDGPEQREAQELARVAFDNLHDRDGWWSR